MIRCKDIILENYFIDPVTAVITNSNGEVQKTKIKNGYACFKKHLVHQLQVHTNLGYKKDYVIHHIDENKMNNSLSNLVYLTPSEHNRIHKKGNKNMFGKHLSEDAKRKMSEANKGNKNMFGKHHSEDAKRKMSEARKGKHYKWITNGIESRLIAENITIPDGFRKGRTINRNIENVGVI